MRADTMTKILLIATAIIEAAAGLGLLARPSEASAQLLGASLDVPAGLILARLGGAALLALAVACWLGRNDANSPAGARLIAAMLVYNAGALAVLAHAGLAARMAGAGLWPAVTLHAALTAWCAACILAGIRRRPGQGR